MSQKYHFDRTFLLSLMRSIGVWFDNKWWQFFSAIFCIRVPLPQKLTIFLSIRIKHLTELECAVKVILRRMCYRSKLNSGAALYDSREYGNWLLDFMFLWLINFFAETKAVQLILLSKSGHILHDYVVTVLTVAKR